MRSWQAGMDKRLPAVIFHCPIDYQHRLGFHHRCFGGGDHVLDLDSIQRGLMAMTEDEKLQRMKEYMQWKCGYISEEQAEEICRLFSEGKGVEEIASAVGLPENVISGLLDSQWDLDPRFKEDPRVW
jgi:hypothetical protein